jgi:hypothetical protein
MTEGEKRLAWGVWLFDMWLAGYGSYRDIEAKVDRGELQPFVRPEDQPRPAEDCDP